jgi:drug/metabolite transporter (DMT)-like permease
MLQKLKWLHWLGLVMVLAGIALLGLTGAGSQLKGMVAIASLLGLGGVLMSPFPVLVFIQWARRQQ